MEALSIVNVSSAGSAATATIFLLTISYRADQFQVKLNHSLVICSFLIPVFCQIERTRAEIEDLLQSFIGDACLRIEDEVYISEQLNVVFERAGANFWAYPALVNFLERSFEQSPLTRLHFHRLTTNVSPQIPTNPIYTLL